MGGRNLLSIPARDVYAYALCLIDVLFTKEELKNSLAFESKKSNCHKSVLDQIRVTKISGKHNLQDVINHCNIIIVASDCVAKKYGQGCFNERMLRQKMNQKCHDAGKATKIPIQIDQ